MTSPPPNQIQQLVSAQQQSNKNIERLSRTAASHDDQLKRIESMLGVLCARIGEDGAATRPQQRPAAAASAAGKPAASRTRQRQPPPSQQRQGKHQQPRSPPRVAGHERTEGERTRFGFLLSQKHLDAIKAVKESEAAATSAAAVVARSSALAARAARAAAAAVTSQQRTAVAQRALRSGARTMTAASTSSPSPPPSSAVWMASSPPSAQRRPADALASTVPPPPASPALAESISRVRTNTSQSPRMLDEARNRRRLQRQTQQRLEHAGGAEFGSDELLNQMDESWRGTRAMLEQLNNDVDESNGGGAAAAGESVSDDERRGRTHSRFSAVSNAHNQSFISSSDMGLTPSDTEDVSVNAAMTPRPDE